MEIGLTGLADAPGFADAAADTVRAWIGDGPVRVRFARSATRDAGGQRVAYVEAAGGVRLNERLLARGLAVPDRDRAGASPHPDAERYALLARQARADAVRAESVGNAPASTRARGLNSGEHR